MNLLVQSCQLRQVVPKAHTCMCIPALQSNPRCHPASIAHASTLYGNLLQEAEQQKEELTKELEALQKNKGVGPLAARAAEADMWQHKARPR